MSGVPRRQFVELGMGGAAGVRDISVSADRECLFPGNLGGDLVR
jgi:hypothetical protein